MTRRTTPMQERAKMPFEVILQLEAMKQESTVFQFQSMEILHPEPPMPSIPPMAAEVVAADAPAVGVGIIVP
jgi:hypothetical protein